MKKNNSVFLNLLDKLNNSATKLFKNSFLASLFLSRRSRDEYSPDETYAETRPNKNIRIKVTSLFEESLFDRTSKTILFRMFNTKLFYFGLFLLTFGFYSAAASVIKNIVYNAISISEVPSIIKSSILIIILSIPLCFSKKTLSKTVNGSKILSSFFENSRIPLDEIDEEYPSVSPIAVFLSATAAGLLCSLFPISKVIILIAAIPLFLMIYLYPESGMVLFILIIPFFGIEVLFTLSLLTFASFWIKILKMQRTFRGGKFDFFITVAVISLFVIGGDYSIASLLKCLTVLMTYVSVACLIRNKTQLIKIIKTEVFVYYVLCSVFIILTILGRQNILPLPYVKVITESFNYAEIINILIILFSLSFTTTVFSDSSHKSSLIIVSLLFLISLVITSEPSELTIPAAAFIITLIICIKRFRIIPILAGAGLCIYEILCLFNVLSLPKSVSNFISEKTKKAISIISFSENNYLFLSEKLLITAVSLICLFVIIRRICRLAKISSQSQIEAVNIDKFFRSAICTTIVFFLLLFSSSGNNTESLLLFYTVIISAVSSMYKSERNDAYHERAARECDENSKLFIELPSERIKNNS